MDNLHGRITRKIASDVLDRLTAKKHLSCKEYGKAKIYLFNQANFPETSQSELDVLDKQIADKKSVLDKNQASLKTHQAGK